MPFFFQVLRCDGLKVSSSPTSRVQSQSYLSYLNTRIFKMEFGFLLLLGCSYSLAHSAVVGGKLGGGRKTTECRFYFEYMSQLVSLLCYHVQKDQN
jgi:hypothetical protein